MPLQLLSPQARTSVARTPPLPTPPLPPLCSVSLWAHHPASTHVAALRSQSFVHRVRRSRARPRPKWALRPAAPPGPSDACPTAPRFPLAPPYALGRPHWWAPGTPKQLQRPSSGARGHTSAYTTILATPPFNQI
ncbi:hypothetical protein NDU88_001028 [Pleurodeles waltl]|uniref:Uncharacterized protein n=1 Tax=Pleurodeles waltl TaxID=8319 RepID=A0AAV7N9M5_PLEWA|nr:hypothetical protein NDU88_001028 [Pleurodeles waltl]